MLKKSASFDWTRHISAHQGSAGERSGYFEHPVRRACDMTRKIAMSFGRKLSSPAAARRLMHQGDPEFVKPISLGSFTLRR